MDLKDFCTNVALEQFSKSKKLQSASERLELIKKITRRLEQAQDDMTLMMQLLQDLERYELDEEKKLNTMLIDLEEREGWK